MAERSRGRPPKYPADEVRLRLLESARKTLERFGPGCGLDPITLDAAIADADVPRGSAYRLWQHDTLTPQQAFRIAVQLDVLRRVGLGAPAVTAKIKETHGEFVELLETGSAEDREWAFRTILRVVANDSYEKLASSRSWLIYRALRSNVVAKAEPRSEALEAVRRGEENQIDAYARMYQEIAKVYGVKIREPYTVRDFAATAFALNEGISSRVTDGFRRRDIMRKTGRSGEEESWTLFAIGFEALTVQFFEMDDQAA